LSNYKDAEITSLLELSERIGRDPLLAQASTGNTSIKIDGILWIKASGKWLGDANRGDFLIPVDLAQVRECVRLNVDPAEKYSSVAGNLRASIETAMHAVLPQRVVIHVHSVNTIAWAVRDDAPTLLEFLLLGLRWQWIPYVPSGLPLAQAIEEAVILSPETDVLVLGNHGLVVCGDDCEAAEALLYEVERRLEVKPRPAPEADYRVLARIADCSPWTLPENTALHALGTDAISRSILSDGLLYPCQAIFSNSTTPVFFCPVPSGERAEDYESRYRDRPFLIVESSGMLIGRTMTPAEYAVLGGLVEVVQRISATAPVRYLTDAEIGSGLNVDAYRYRELADANHAVRTA
jgi:rhamnose utilization protein RhaD (predicted bifunctional aldolase and dehydrogenase)